VTTEPGDNLTAREWTIAQLVARDWTDARIARQLFLSPATVGTDLRNVKVKIGAADRTGVVKWVVEREAATAAGTDAR
jgi:DNA-binding NarL/FixJ family response regulator